MLNKFTQSSKRLVAYYRSNGFLQTVQKLFIKIRQKPLFRFHGKNEHLYDVFRHSIEDRHEEYQDYRKLQPAEAIIKYIAFYLPQFHPIEENDRWWGTGFTEWVNVSRALPQYRGHQQPRRPADLGFYDLRLNEVRKQQIELAKNYGISGFCYHYYWFSGKTLLDYPINALLNDKTLDFPFCINWANENWTRRWDGKDSDVLMAQSYSNEDYLNFIKEVIKYLRDDRYIRVDGKPLLMVYRPSLIPDVKGMAGIWRNYCREVGLGEIYLVLTHSFEATAPEAIGFDAAVEFSPNNMPLKGASRKIDYINKAFSGNIYEYGSALDLAKKYNAPGYTKFRCVCPSWDNEARKTGKGTVLDGAKPSLYKKWLDVVNEQTIRDNDEKSRFVFINAWNEWAEGAYLEPDKRFGFGYLDVTYRALNAAARAMFERRIVLISHDAHPHGAQYLLLHIAKQLSQNLKFNVDVVFLQGGELVSDFSRYANVTDISGKSSEDIGLFFQQLYGRGVRSAILNTVVTGMVSSVVKKTGFRVVSLVHEMPELIRSSGYANAASLLEEHSDIIVFPADVVKRGFEEIVDKLDDKAVIQPQGIFRKNRLSGQQIFTASHTELCRKLDIPESSKIVLNIGYGDHRKGIDLFVDIAETVCRSVNHAYFIWVGHLDPVMQSKLQNRVKKVGLDSNILFMGKDFETDIYYAGSDIFALTSREDPFPSVVLEAIDAGMPVFGFKGAGGFTDIISRGVGVLISAFDTKAYSEEIIRLFNDENKQKEYSLNAKKIAVEEYNFPDYIFRLLELSENTVKKVSVIIPNFNYEKYIKQRIQSVLKQNYPVYEIIVLDDHSSDGSVDIIRTELEQSEVNFRLVVNNCNSGSVFDQWHKGASMVRGDYVWIAEADDFSDPDFLGEIMKAFDDDNVVLSFCKSCQVDSGGNIIEGDYQNYLSDISATKWRRTYVNDGLDEIKTAFCVKNTIPNVSSVVFRKNALLSVLNEHLDMVKQYRVAGDWVTYLHVLAKGKIAYSAKAFNYHRRHDSSVTLNRFDERLLAEIMSVQKYVNENFEISAPAIDLAERYAQELYEQFGLKTSESPTINDHAELQRLIK